MTAKCTRLAEYGISLETSHSTCSDRSLTPEPESPNTCWKIFYLLSAYSSAMLLSIGPLCRSMQAHEAINGPIMPRACFCHAGLPGVLWYALRLSAHLVSFGAARVVFQAEMHQQAEPMTSRELDPSSPPPCSRLGIHVKTPPALSTVHAAVELAPPEPFRSVPGNSLLAAVGDHWCSSGCSSEWEPRPSVRSSARLRQGFCKATWAVGSGGLLLLLSPRELFR